MLGFGLYDFEGYFFSIISCIYSISPKLHHQAFCYVHDLCQIARHPCSPGKHMVRRLETFFHHWWNLMNYQKSVKNSPLVSVGPWFHPLGEGCLTQGHGKKLSSSFLASSPFSCLWVGKQQKWRVKSAETITQPPAHHRGCSISCGLGPHFAKHAVYKQSLHPESLD